MRVKVDGARCQGHARCWAQDPVVFELNDEGYMAGGTIAIPPGAEERARRAVRACPERALSLEE